MLKFFVLVFLGSVSLSAFTDTTSMKQDAKEAKNDTVRGTKKALRDVKDETCEMINGKMECTAKKAKHSIQNSADKVEDAVE